MQLTGLLHALKGLLPAEVAEPTGMPSSHAVLRVMARHEVGLGVLEMMEDALARLLLEAPNETGSVRHANFCAYPTGKDCSKCVSIFDQHNYLRKKTWVVKMTPAAFDTGVCIRDWTAPIRLNCRSDTETGTCVSGADADSFGKVLYKYYGIIQKDLHNLGFKFSMTQPLLVPLLPASHTIEMVVTISLDMDAPVQEQLVLNWQSTF